MKVDLGCFLCCEKKALSLMNQYQVPREKTLTVLKEIYGEFACCEETISAPVLMARMLQILEKRVEISDAYEEPKERYNGLLLKKSEEIEKEIQQSEDPFLQGLRCALTGNYIDFGAMDAVSEEKLGELLEKCRDIIVDEEAVSRLRKDLQKAKTLLYLTDNAGEIVLDLLWLRVIRKCYPHLEISVMVRGEPVLNDATRKDAEKIGMTLEFPVLTNGAGIPGTPPEYLEEKVRDCLRGADVLIAKGQGNFESLHGSGLPVYYLFLCKCDLFVEKFQVERFAPVLRYESDFV